MVTPVFRITVLIATIALSVPLTRADTLDVYVNDDAARAAYETPLRESGLDLDIGFLHHQDEGSLGHAGLYVAGVAGKGANTFDVSLGGRLLLADTELGDGSALGLGGRVAYLAPQVEGLELGMFMFYAPESISFGGIDSVFDFGVLAGYRVLERSTVYLSVNSTRTDFERGGRSRVDKGLHFGFRTAF